MISLFRPGGPLFVLIVPWSVVLGLSSLSLCRIYTPHFSLFHMLVLANIATALLFAIVIHFLFPMRPQKQKNSRADIQISKKMALTFYSLILFFFLGQILQALINQGFPLLTLLTKGELDYKTFGISSLNGLLYSCYLLGASGIYLLHLKQKSVASLLMLTLLFSAPILLLSRYLLITLFLQITSTHLFYEPNSIYKFIRRTLLFFAAFIILGNLRTGLNILIQILGPTREVPELFYPLLWIYAYLVSAFYNIQESIDFIRPTGTPICEVIHLVPSFLRNLFFSEDDLLMIANFQLVHENLTACTFYFEPLVDFGPLYAFFFMAFFQVYILFAYRKANKTGATVDVLCYSILYMIAALAIFSNTLLSLPTLGELILLQCARLSYDKNRGLYPSCLKNTKN